MIGKPISTYVLEALQIRHHPLTWVAAFAGAWVGTFSHVALDALMHGDMRPWWPLAGGNPLLGAIDVGRLHVACAVLGIVGLLAIAARGRLRGKA